MAYPYPQQPQYAGFAPPPPNYGAGGGYPSAPQMGMPMPGPYGGFPPQQQPGPGGFPYPQQGMPMGMGMGMPPPMGGFPFHPQPEAPKPDVAFHGGEMGGGGSGYDFTEKSIRMAFIRKVYSILSIQLALTAGLIALFVLHDGVRLWTRQNMWFFFVALAMTVVLIIALTCCEGVRRKSPGNIICLGIFTLCEGIVLGVAASTYSANEVLLATGITAVVCLALTAFSFQTKWDFTTMGGILFVAVIIMLVFSLVAAFLSHKFPILRLIYACLGALVFSVYLIYDTQQIMGGKKYSISPEEYIFAALSLYLDMVQIFMYILQIIGYANDN